MNKNVIVLTLHNGDIEVFSSVNALEKWMKMFGYQYLTIDSKDGEIVNYDIIHEFSDIYHKFLSKIKYDCKIQTRRDF